MKIVLMLIILLSILGSCKNSKKDFICSSNNAECVTFMQYHKFSEPENAGIYLIYGKYTYNVTPKNDYIFFRYSDYPFYYKWENDRFIIRFPGCDIIEDKLETNKIDFKIDFTLSEKEKYIGTSKEEFYRNVLSDFESKTTSDLSKNW